jgi:hypothetical protein
MRSQVFDYQQDRLPGDLGRPTPGGFAVRCLSGNPPVAAPFQDESPYIS